MLTNKLTILVYLLQQHARFDFLHSHVTHVYYVRDHINPVHVADIPMLTVFVLMLALG